MVNFSVTYLLQLVLPPILRKPTSLAFLEAVAEPFETLQSNLYGNHEHTKELLKFNGQVCYLEHVLNDNFDFSSRQIYIGDGNVNPLTYVFDESEPNEDLILFNQSEGGTPPYLYNLSEIAIEVDFIVFYPGSIVPFDENLMRSIIDRYRCASKRYLLIEI